MGRSNKFVFDNSKRIEKLSQKEQENLIWDLLHAFIVCKNLHDAAFFLQDLLTKTEMKILAKRLRIAKLLLSGMTYREIEKHLHVGYSTVAKISAWLSERGDGFRKIVKKLPNQPQEKSWTEISDWDRFKRKHALYFWPELLLEEVIKSANKKQKDRIRNVLEKLEEKSELHKKIDALLKYRAT